MPTYKLLIPVDVRIPVTTTAANESRALEIALARIGEYLRTWSRKIGPTADISIRKMPDDYPLTDELFARGDPDYDLQEYRRKFEEYRRKCQNAFVAKGYLPKAIERIDVKRHYKRGEKPEDVAEHLYYEDNLDGTN